MSDQQRPGSPPSKERILAHVRRALASGRVIPTVHLREQLLKRGHDMQDVIKVLRLGTPEARAQESALRPAARSLDLPAGRE